MARKKKHAEHVNHERWLVSYADFITLLFAFFVVMFAVSQVDSKKVGRFSESFSKAVGIFPQPGTGVMPGVSDAVPSVEAASSNTSALPEELSGLSESLTQAARIDESLQAIQVVARRHELVLRLSDGLLFDSGNDVLREPATRVLQHIVAELKKHNVDVRVEGHTDNRPIKNARFRSNWDLSTARSTAVVARLVAEGIAAPRLSAAGYGEFHPLGESATEEGKKKNRRVDLIVSVTSKEPSEP